MQNLSEFLQHYGIWLTLLGLAWAVVGLSWGYFRGRKTRLVFPQLSPEHILFDERASSGCSHKTRYTRWGGARNCLHVTVTDTEVWIRLNFPFSLFAQRLDLEHRIARAAITSIEPQQTSWLPSLLLDYHDARGEAHRLSLTLRKPDDFLKALSLRSPTLGS